ISVLGGWPTVSHPILRQRPSLTTRSAFIEEFGLLTVRRIRHITAAPGKFESQRRCSNLPSSASTILALMTPMMDTISLLPSAAVLPRYSLKWLTHEPFAHGCTQAHTLGVITPTTTYPQEGYT